MKHCSGPVEELKLLEPAPNRPGARRGPALADKVDVREVGTEVLRHPDDLFVHCSKEQLILRGTPLSLFLLSAHHFPSGSRRNFGRGKCLHRGRDRPRSDLHCSAEFGWSGIAVKIVSLQDRAQIQAIETLGDGTSEEASAAIGRLLAVTQATYERRAQLEHALRHRSRSSRPRESWPSDTAWSPEEAFQIPSGAQPARIG